MIRENAYTWLWESTRGRSQAQLCIAGGQHDTNHPIYGHQRWILVWVGTWTRFFSWSQKFVNFGAKTLKYVFQCPQQAEPSALPPLRFLVLPRQVLNLDSSWFESFEWFAPDSLPRHGKLVHPDTWFSMYRLDITDPQRNWAFESYLGDHAACSNHRPSVNSHTRQNDDIAANPTIISHIYWFGILGSFCPIPDFRIQRVRRGHEWGVGAYKSSVANRNFCDIEERTVGVQKDVRTKIDVGAVFSLHRWLHPRVVVKKCLVLHRIC